MQVKFRLTQQAARMAGITLLELMIVVIIVGILAAIAYPSYQSTILRTKRADGKSVLLNTAQVLERCNTRSATYVGCANVTFPVTSPDGHYTVTTAALSAAAFTLSAAPQGPQANDTDCGALVLTSAGVQGSQGILTDVNGCW